MKHHGWDRGHHLDWHLTGPATEEHRNAIFRELFTALNVMPTTALLDSLPSQADYVTVTESTTT